MLFQDVDWTIIADGMSSAEVEIAKVTLMIRVKILENDDSIMLFWMYENIYHTHSNTR